MGIIARKQRYHSIKRFGGNREAVLDRDSGKCVLCGEEAKLVHHKKGLSCNAIEDLQSLCFRCHALAHVKDNQKARALKTINYYRNMGWTDEQILIRTKNKTVETLI